MSMQNKHFLHIHLNADIVLMEGVAMPKYDWKCPKCGAFNSRKIWECGNCDTSVPRSDLTEFEQKNFDENFDKNHPLLSRPVANPLKISD